MEQQNQIEFNTQSQQVAPQPQMPMSEQQVVMQSSEQIKYAGFWIRWVAYLIDVLVLIIPNIAVNLIIKFIPIGAIQSILASISSLLVSWIYFILMTNKYQATLGKKAVGIRVSSDKLESLTLGQVILRETIGKLISMIILLIGYIMAGFTERKQALHDKIASTVVVYNDPNKKMPIWAIIIAIIFPLLIVGGIFASIVLVSLNSARNKAQEAAKKATLSSTTSEVAESTKVVSAPINTQATLTNTFKDDNLGYEIKYPADWKNFRDDDKENGVEAVVFSPKEESPSLTVAINKIKDNEGFDSNKASFFIGVLKSGITDAKGKAYETKDYVYTFSDGTKASGKQFESEYTDDLGKVKQWIVVIPSGKNMFWMTYVSDINKYDSQLPIATSMLDSWKITK